MLTNTSISKRASKSSAGRSVHPRLLHLCRRSKPRHPALRRRKVAALRRRLPLQHRARGPLCRAPPLAPPPPRAPLRTALAPGHRAPRPPASSPRHRQPAPPGSAAGAVGSRAAVRTAHRYRRVTLHVCLRRASSHSSTVQRSCRWACDRSPSCTPVTPLGGDALRALGEQHSAPRRAPRRYRPLSTNARAMRTATRATMTTGAANPARSHTVRSYKVSVWTVPWLRRLPRAARRSRQ